MVLVSEHTPTSNDPNAKFIGQRCAKCTTGTYKETSCFNIWWVQCNDCDSFLFCYTPMAHQHLFHEDPHKVRMWSGGYGSAKTSTCGAEFVMLALSTPKGVGLVGATTYPQLEQTSKKQVLEMLPEDFIDNVDKKNNIVYLTNGYEIMFRSFDDQQKLRSLNLCHAWIN